jgi:hypothetical protein
MLFISLSYSFLTSSPYKAYTHIPFNINNCINFVNSNHYHDRIVTHKNQLATILNNIHWTQLSSSNRRNSAAGTGSSTSSHRGKKILSNSKQQQHGRQKHNNNQNNRFKNAFVEKTVVIAYNKPRNVLTTHSNDEASMILIDKNGSSIRRQTVYNDIQTVHGWVCTQKSDENNSDNETFETITGIRSKLHAIGRLDCDTTGL